MGFNLNEKGRPAIDAETCIGCGQCVAICPDEVLSLDDGKAAAGPGRVPRVHRLRALHGRLSDRGHRGVRPGHDARGPRRTAAAGRPGDRRSDSKPC